MNSLPMGHSGDSVLWSIEQHRPISPFQAFLCKIGAWGLVHSIQFHSFTYPSFAYKMLSVWAPACAVNIEPEGTNVAARSRDPTNGTGHSSLFKGRAPRCPFVFSRLC